MYIKLFREGNEVCQPAWHVNHPRWLDSPDSSNGRGHHLCLARGTYGQTNQYGKIRVAAGYPQLFGPILTNPC